jgi:hypothetical protein
MYLNTFWFYSTHFYKMYLMLLKASSYLNFSVATMILEKFPEIIVIPRSLNLRMSM